MGAGHELVVRWTIGAVSRAGFEALALSIAGAARLFDAAARYVVCVNTMGVDAARELAGPLACQIEVEWRRATPAEIPPFLRARLDDDLAQGTGWKFAPLRVADAPLELALDNDCILWRLPAAVRAWLVRDAPSVVAEDVRACFGWFADECGAAPRNSGLRGLSAEVPFARLLREVLASHPGPLQSEVDEQGLQVAALVRHAPPLVVPTRDVSICSPLAAHQHELGRCGAHFVGLNSVWSRWTTDEGRPITEGVQAHWARLKDDVAARVRRAQSRAALN